MSKVIDSKTTDESARTVAREIDAAGERARSAKPRPTVPDRVAEAIDREALENERDARRTK